MKVESNNPLVSIVVITYNSSKYVIETLESAKSQTYQNIELIISDDSSIDNTVKNCQQWIEKNREWFIRIELITIPENTGVSANCNRGIKAAHGEWLKLIAGDDVLLPNCISDNIQYTWENKDAHIIFSQAKVYKNEFKKEWHQKDLPAKFPNNLMHPLFTAEDQFKILILSDRITYTPSYFCNKQAILKVGGFDEINRLVEDYPMWLKLTKSGERLYYFHKPTVAYRSHPGATNNVGDQVLFKSSVINSFFARKKYAHPHLPWMMVARETWSYRISIIFKALGWNKNTASLRWLYALFTVYLNPFVYLHAINKRITLKK